MQKLCILTNTNTYTNEIISKNKFYKEMKKFKESDNIKIFIPINK